MTTLFISHAANDPQWPEEVVLALADRFSAAGVDVELDLVKQRQIGRKLSPAEWRAWMYQALNNARYVLCLPSERYNEACRRRHNGDGSGRGVAYEILQVEQWLYEERQHNGRVFLYLPESTGAPDMLRGVCPQYRCPREEDALIAHLSNPVDATRRDAYLRRLRALVQAEHTDLYVPLAGEGRGADIASQVLLPQSVEQRENRGGDYLKPVEHRDILDAVRPRTRALVLGEPGAGKTFALLKVLESDLKSARLPLWVKLNHWLDDDQSFKEFVGEQAPEIGADWTAAVRAGNCRLLLDGLNELPARQATARHDAIAKWLNEHPHCPVLLSCREADLPSGMFRILREQLIVKPLRPAQVRQFIANYMPQQPGTAEALFWRLAGDKVGKAVLREAWAARPAAVAGNPAAEEAALNALVEGGQDCAHWLDAAGRERCAGACGDPLREYPLATNWTCPHVADGFGFDSQALPGG